MNKWLEWLLETALGKVRSGECDISDDLVAKLVKICEEESDERRPYVKTEVASRLGVTTRTVDRYVANGLLCAGRKRQGHKSLYWLKSDIDECRRVVNHN